MIYALVHYPDVDTTRINQLRREYDPQFGLIGPHITFVFPVPESVGEQLLVSHIDRVLSHWRSFPIRLKGLIQSSDNYLFLLLAQGRTEALRMHDELYTGMLAPYLNEDVPFVPHVTLGAFGENTHLYPRMLSDAERMEFDYESRIDRLELVKINDDRTRIVWSKTFRLRQ